MPPGVTTGSSKCPLHIVQVSSSCRPAKDTLLLEQAADTCSAGAVAALLAMPARAGCDTNELIVLLKINRVIGSLYILEKGLKRRLRFDSWRGNLRVLPA
jgi:hypothetical protein